MFNELRDHCEAVLFTFNPDIANPFLCSASSYRLMVGPMGVIRTYSDSNILCHHHSWIDGAPHRSSLYQCHIIRPERGCSRPSFPTELRLLSHINGDPPQSPQHISIWINSPCVWLEMTSPYSISMHALELFRSCRRSRLSAIKSTWCSKTRTSVFGISIATSSFLALYRQVLSPADHGQLPYFGCRFGAASVLCIQMGILHRRGVW